MRDDFIWGVAASAYQTEGAVHEDGRGESIWDRFAPCPATCGPATRGAVACDFFHRYPEDVELMRELGVDAFRFSVAWPRVLPAGRGRVNAAGLDFYDRLVDELLAAGIEPFAALFHWDLPQALQDEGGWLARATAEAFAEYAAVVPPGSATASRTGRRTTSRSAPRGSATASASTRRAEGAPPTRSRPRTTCCSRTGSPSLRSGSRRPSRGRDHPRLVAGARRDRRPADVAAAWAADGVRNRWFFDALLRGEYPQDVLERFGGRRRRCRRATSRRSRLRSTSSV